MFKGKLNKVFRFDVNTETLAGLLKPGLRESQERFVMARLTQKLSEEIQIALNNKDFLDDYEPVFEHKPLRYSKRKEGEVMLENIDPNIVKRHCTVFFKEAFLDLQKV